MTEENTPLDTFLTELSQVFKNTDQAVEQTKKYSYDPKKHTIVIEVGELPTILKAMYNLSFVYEARAKTAYKKYRNTVNKQSDEDSSELHLDYTSSRNKEQSVQKTLNLLLRELSSEKLNQEETFVLLDNWVVAITRASSNQKTRRVKNMICDHDLYIVKTEL